MKGEDDRQSVGHLDRADSACVGNSGPAVDQDIVVGRAHLLPGSFEKGAAAQSRVERLPIEAVDTPAIGFILSSCRNQIERTAKREIVAERDRKTLNVSRAR